MGTRAGQYDDDDWDDEEFPDDPEDSGTIDCPSCGAEIYEEAPQCPVCGEYVVRGSSGIWQGKSPAYIVLAALGIAAVILSLIFIY